METTNLSKEGRTKCQKATTNSNITRRMLEDLSGAPIDEALPKHTYKRLNVLNVDAGSTKGFHVLTCKQVIAQNWTSNN